MRLMTEHIATCERHPLKRIAEVVDPIQQENDSLKAELEHLRGEREQLLLTLKPFVEAYAEFTEDWDSENNWEINPELDLTLDVPAKYWKAARGAAREQGGGGHAS